MKFALPAIGIAITVMLLATLTGMATASRDTDLRSSRRSMLVALVAAASLAFQIAILCTKVTST